MEKNTIPYVCVYADYLQVLAPFSDEEQGRLLMAMLRYSQTGAEPEFTGNERFIWPSLKGQLDRDMEAYQRKCEQNRRNGQKGGRPAKEKTEGFSEKPKKPKEKEKEKEKENEKEKKREKKKESPSGQAALSENPPACETALFCPPTRQQVEGYCKKEGYRIDPGRFVDYYTANGWRMGSAPMQDWKAALRCWNGKERTDGKITLPPTWVVGTEL